jgi:hypothetical protein
MSIPDFDKLVFAADRVNLLPATYAKQLVISNVRTIAEKSGYIEGALPGNDLFSGIELKKKKVRKMR